MGVEDDGVRWQRIEAGWMRSSAVLKGNFFAPSWRRQLLSSNNFRQGVAVLSWLGKGGGLLVIGLWNLPQARALSG